MHENIFPEVGSVLLGSPGSIHDRISTKGAADSRIQRCLNCCRTQKNKSHCFYAHVGASNWTKCDFCAANLVCFVGCNFKPDLCLTAVCVKQWLCSPRRQPISQEDSSAFPHAYQAHTHAQSLLQANNGTLVVRTSEQSRCRYSINLFSDKKKEFYQWWDVEWEDKGSLRNTMYTAPQHTHRKFVLLPSSLAPIEFLLGGIGF